uniref:Uncharacterized protein n=1 Tax=Coccolithus braarudii TaxID=221442 RepID=A0A7S0LPD9_9EUKA|mmetsp:Transcript_51252/g.109533  ORF Transcript_51252/g.109533 Transcript_51252/m.109533 type:complete len:287 (+) Transcript_51252:536-1396(+)
MWSPAEPANAQYVFPSASRSRSSITQRGREFRPTSDRPRRCLSIQDAMAWCSIAVLSLTHSLLVAQFDPAIRPCVSYRRAAWRMSAAEPQRSCATECQRDGPSSFWGSPRSHRPHVSSGLQAGPASVISLTSSFITPGSAHAAYAQPERGSAESAIYDFDPSLEGMDGLMALCAPPADAASAATRASEPAMAALPTALTSVAPAAASTTTAKLSTTSAATAAVAAAAAAALPGSPERNSVKADPLLKKLSPVTFADADYWNTAIQHPVGVNDLFHDGILPTDGSAG